MKLIGATASPYVRKVRIVLAEKQLECEFVTTNVWASDSTITQVNPLGKVPCLLLGDGTPMYDSRVIVEYLDALSSSAQPLLPASAHERATVKTWEALADGALDAGILARLEATWGARTDEQRSQAWIDRQLGKIDQALAEMARGLGEQPYCCGEQFTLADAAVGSALGWFEFRFPQIDWRARHANLARLHEQLAKRASFAGTRPS